MLGFAQTQATIFNPYPIMVNITSASDATFPYPTSHVVPIASGNVGDLLIVGLYTAQTISVQTWPAGWTLLASLSNPGGSGYGPFELHYRIADGSETSSITITTASGRPSGYHSIRLRNADIPVIAISAHSAELNNSQALTSGYGSIETLWLSWIGFRDSQLRTVVTFPTGYTNTVQARANVTEGAGVARGEKFSIAASDTACCWSFDNAASSIIATIAIKSPRNTPNGQAQAKIIIRDNNKFAQVNALIQPPTVYPIVQSVATYDYNSSGLSSFPITMPSGIQSGDLLVMYICSGWYGPTGIIALPTGWTQVTNANLGTVPDGTLAVGYRIANGSEGSTQTATSSVVAQMAGVTYRISNYQGVPAHSQNGTSNTAFPTFASLTSGFGVIKTLWLAGFAFTNNVDRSTFSSGYSNPHEVDPGALGPSITVVEKTSTASSETPGNAALTSPSWWYTSTLGIEGSFAEVTLVYGQAQAYITGAKIVLAQSQADIKATGLGFGQTLAFISKSAGYAQAQAFVTKFAGYGQARARIVTGIYSAQAQAIIQKGSNGYGQAACFIVAKKGYGQAQASIKRNSTLGFGQASFIIRTPLAFSLVVGYIKHTNNNVYGQTQTQIGSFKYAQSLASIIVKSNKSGQAQSRVIYFRQAYAQSQAYINTTRQFGQANALIISLTKVTFGQAAAQIKGINVKGYGQASSLILKNVRKVAQAQAYIKGYYNAQAQALITRAKSGLGQSNAMIYQKGISFAQAKASITNTKPTGLVRAVILGQRYFVSYNGYELPGYAQQETHDSIMSIKTFGSPYRDMSFSEYTGLENKMISLRLKVVGENYLDCKNQIELAGTLVRSNRTGFAPLYIQHYDRHYEALTKLIKTEASTSNIKTSEYTVEFECKPWLINDKIITISGTGLVQTSSRTINNGGWTPANITVTGTNVTVSGYTGTGDFTGFVSISGSVVNYVPVNPQIYIGPGTTYFQINGATNCIIEYQDRWYL